MRDDGEMRVSRVISLSRIWLFGIGFVYIGPGAGVDTTAHGVVMVLGYADGDVQDAGATERLPRFQSIHQLNRWTTTARITRRRSRGSVRVKACGGAIRRLTASGVGKCRLCHPVPLQRPSGFALGAFAITTLQKLFVRNRMATHGSRIPAKKRTTL